MVNAIKLEQYIFNQDKDNLVILVTHFNGLEMKGIFSDINLARKFAIRYCINHITINNTTGCDLKEYEYKQKYNEAYKSLEFEFLHTSHLSKNSPIYILHSDDYKIYGKPHDYLTNDKNTWIYRMQQNAHNETSSAHICTVDPELEFINSAQL